MGALLEESRPERFVDCEQNLETWLGNAVDLDLAEEMCMLRF